MNILTRPRDVNESQWQAVIHAGGHLLIVAGPGTGKTHTLTHRIARTAESLKNHQWILAITFTNKAAEEMRERLSGRFSSFCDRIFVGTFHGFCLRYLREHIARTDLPPDFGIAARRDIERIAKELWRGSTPKERGEKIQAVSQWKTRDFLSRAFDGPPEVSAYNRLLRENGLLDYEDLLLEALKLLSAGAKTAFPFIASADTPRLDAGSLEGFIFVDEYQDINSLQHALLKKLAGSNAWITAIGDPNQAVYGFRGASPRFFESFPEDFPGARILHLSENYRSPANLLKASGQVMAKAQGGFLFQLTAGILEPGRIVIHEASTERAEAEYVVHQIERMLGGTSMFSRDSARVKTTPRGGEMSFKDIAVLYRLNAQKIPLEEALARHGIPYETSGGRPFVELAPVFELTALLKDLRGSSASNDDLQTLMDQLPQTAAGEKIFKDSRPAWRKNVERFLRMAKRFDHAEEFFDHLVLERPEDEFDRFAEKVRLMTLHSSKGLEFPVVFIAGCEEHILPLSLEGMISDPAEERRLFYVGMTRAKEILFLTCAGRRRLFGRNMNNPPSAFLADIEDELKEREQARLFPKRKPKLLSSQMEFFGE